MDIYVCVANGNVWKLCILLWQIISHYQMTSCCLYCDFLNRSDIGWYKSLSSVNVSKEQDRINDVMGGVLCLDVFCLLLEHILHSIWKVSLWSTFQPIEAKRTITFHLKSLKTKKQTKNKHHDISNLVLVKSTEPMNFYEILQY